MFFFCKQRRAYEMRISDWSSDVCSSDLLPTGHRVPGIASSRSPRGSDANRCSALRRCAREKPTICELDLVDPVLVLAEISCRRTVATPFRHPRSEEHTSELQSLMRISYAVFCLKKKNKETTKHTRIN